MSFWILKNNFEFQMSRNEHRSSICFWKKTCWQHIQCASSVCFRGQGVFYRLDKRIWPFYDLLRILPKDVVLSKDEERSVDGEAVLSDWDGVVQGHGSGSLRFGLFEGWWNSTCGDRRSIPIPTALRTPIPGSQQTGNIVSEASHSVWSKNREI